MQFTLKAVKGNVNPPVITVTQYGSDSLTKAAAYNRRIHQEFDGYTSWETIQCTCENNGDFCEACELFHSQNVFVVYHRNLAAAERDGRRRY